MPGDDTELIKCSLAVSTKLLAIILRVHNEAEQHFTIGGSHDDYVIDDAIGVGLYSSSAARRSPTNRGSYPRLLIR